MLRADDPVPVSPGAVIAGKYRVDGVLGRGGFGVVVAATHLALRQPVAIKILLPTVARAGDAGLRLQREAQAASRLRGEHTARVLDFGALEDGSTFMVMERLHGQDLAQIIRERSPIPLPLAIEFVLQACEALAEAHALGIVHRDVKPANLFLTARHDGSPCVKVVDFGMSKSLTDLQGNLTKTTAVLGTPYYMSPEQMRSSKHVTSRADVWSLGIVLHELLAGRVPYNGDTLGELCSRVFTRPPDPLRAQRPEVPEALERVVLRCLQKAEGDRYPSVAHLAVDLAPFAPPHAQVHVDRVVRTLGFGDRSAVAGCHTSVPPPAPPPSVAPPAPASAARQSAAPPPLTQSQVRDARASGVRLVAGAGVLLALSLALAVGVLVGRRAPEGTAATGPSAAPSAVSAPSVTSASTSASAGASGAPPAPPAPVPSASQGAPPRRAPSAAPRRSDEPPMPAPKRPPDDDLGDFHVRH
ncbi:MAG: serine/threonine protein kinase [Polyangiaceae bacterium]|nr:serine/threonine protein kinase [Polyangiaceae bacterium]